MEGLVLKCVEVHVEIQDMEIFLDMEANNYTLLNGITIGSIKQVYCQVYNLYAYALHS